MPRGAYRPFRIVFRLRDHGFRLLVRVVRPLDHVFLLLDDTFRRQVQHPGTEARKFDKAAAKLAETEFPKRMEQSVKEGTR